MTEIPKCVPPVTWVQVTLVVQPEGTKVWEAGEWVNLPAARLEVRCTRCLASTVMHGVVFEAGTFTTMVSRLVAVHDKCQEPVVVIDTGAVK